MRFLLDANIPKRLKPLISGHEVRTARDCGFQDLDDGPLIAAMQDRFDVLVTCDKSLRFQQNFTHTTLAIIVLRARSNRLDDLAPLVPRLLADLLTIRPSEVRIVTADGQFR